jgi:hypothetical protein
MPNLAITEAVGGCATWCNTGMGPAGGLSLVCQTEQ